MCVDDCGTILNPLLVDGQRHGGIAQGVAQALMEEIAYDEHGNPQTDNFVTYSPISAAELPMFELVSMETPTPVNPLGAKGIGESATIGSTSAAHNAVIDALVPLGVRDVDMPATSQRVWLAIQAARSGNGAGRGLAIAVAAHPDGAAVEQRVEEALGRLDLDRRRSACSPAPASGARSPSPQIGLRAMVVSDGPAGVRGGAGTSATPPRTCRRRPRSPRAGTRSSLERLGGLLAAEARRKGVDVLLAPGVNLHRSPLGGRHFECFSEDPVLTGADRRGLRARRAGRRRRRDRQALRRQRLRDRPVHRRRRASTSARCASCTSRRSSTSSRDAAPGR